MSWKAEDFDSEWPFHEQATKFELKKAEERAHILIGLSISVENLDKAIKIIRNSKTPDHAKKSLLNTKWKINYLTFSYVHSKISIIKYCSSEHYIILLHNN